MPATPGTASRRRSHHNASCLDVPEDLQPYMHDKVLLVPRYVFPKEKVPANFRGWQARITAADDRMREDGQHVLVAFEGYPYQDQYHFSVDEVRRWLAGGSPAKRQATAAAPAGEGGEPAAPALARRSARKPSKPSAGSRTPGTAARRRSPAAARLRAVAEGEEEEGEGEEAEQRQQGEAQQADREAEEEAEEHPQAAAAAAEGQQGQPLPRLRKRKASAVGASDEAGRQKRQEGEGGAAVEQGGAAEGTWFGKAANLAKEALFSTTAVGVCYGLLRALYPEAP